jgi:RNA polymerase primary sigma factor
MEQLHEYLAETAQSLGIAADDTSELVETNPSEREEAAEEAVSTDDPVRVYLREMGAVRLLSRKGEIDLAKRMEHGKLRMRKALSRSPIIWQRALSIREGVLQGQIRLNDVVEMGGFDETARERARKDIAARLGKFVRLWNWRAKLPRRRNDMCICARS